ncbi:hypothetical protein K432DRAFT_380266 [Lepidopterella palustris CBS 459.81]|uniref:Uncharacterized protein n=1 Tax=Lepidopterella palustris CBS 459.81 TaxID=1314670 RepID=A0A8E2JHY8_9PEZI|nr:hypothetical protein K432DRAFT_380266 [Lepidopterella palustris CBS 459.81]
MAATHSQTRAGRDLSSARKHKKAKLSTPKSKTVLKKVISPQRRKNITSKQSQAKESQSVESQARESLETTAPTAAPIFTFMDLSGELRNQIYREALLSVDPIKVGQPRSCNPVHRGGLPSLLRVSSQIRKEAISIYYGENTFNFSDESVNNLTPSKRLCSAVRFRNWCEAMGVENIKWIKALNLTLIHCPSCIIHRLRWSWHYECDIFPFVDFAVKHPNCKIQLCEPQTHRGCGCGRHIIESPTIEKADFADMVKILNEPAWIQELESGNIVKILMHFRRYGERYEVSTVVYSRQASIRTSRENGWQALCDRLSLPYAFNLKPESVRGGMRFMMEVEKRQEPERGTEAMEVD